MRMIIAQHTYARRQNLRLSTKKIYKIDIENGKWYLWSSLNRQSQILVISCKRNSWIWHKKSPKKNKLYPTWLNKTEIHRKEKYSKRSCFSRKSCQTSESARSSSSLNRFIWKPIPNWELSRVLQKKSKENNHNILVTESKMTNLLFQPLNSWNRRKHLLLHCVRHQDHHHVQTNGK